MSGVWLKKQDDWKLKPILLSECKVAYCNPHEGNQTCSPGETQFQSARWTIFSKKFLEILDYQDFDAKININSFQNEPYPTGLKLSIETLLEETKPVVIETWDWKSTKIIEIKTKWLKF